MGIIGTMLINVVRGRTNTNKIAFKAALPSPTIKQIKTATVKTFNARKSLFDLFANKLSKFNGEKASIIANAAGKAIISPIVIAYNPFSKESEETKTLTAWKQPIAAVVNYTTQFVINLQVGKYINMLAENGKLGEFYNLKSKTIEKALVHKRVSRFNDFVGLAISIATMPLIIKTTNYIYPKVMDKLFPKKPT